MDFDQRNALFDEAIEVIRGVWSQDEFAYEGMTFTAKGQSAIQAETASSDLDRREQPPLAPACGPLRRRVEPVPRPQDPGHHRETCLLESLDDLRSMLDELWQFVEEAGRDPAEIDVSFGSNAGGDPGTDAFDPEAQLAATEELATLGVTWCGVGVPGDSLAYVLETLERFGKSVIR